MSTYPLLTINGFAVPSADRRINLDRKSPVRQINIAPEVPISGAGGFGQGFYVTGAHDLPLFVVRLLIVGTTSWETEVPDRLMDDVEYSIGDITTLCSHRQMNELVWQETVTRSRRAWATLVSIIREDSNRDHAILTVTFRLTTPFWRDSNTVATQTFTPVTGSQNFTLSADFTGTAPVLNPTMTITGPCTNPSFYDYGSMEGLMWTGTVPAATNLVITRDGATLGGVASNATWGAYSSNSWIDVTRNFRLTPTPLTAGDSPFLWRPKIGFSCTGPNANTRFKVEGYRSWR